MSVPRHRRFLLGACALAVSAVGQEAPFIPAGEIGAEWSYNNLETSNAGNGAWSNENGGSLYGQYFLGKARRVWHGQNRFGIAARFDGTGSQSGSLYTGMAGPRFGIEWRKSHLLWFGEYLIGDAQVRVDGMAQTASSFSRNSFIWGEGSGLQLILSRRFTVTLVHLDALSLEAPDAVTGRSHWQGDLRFSAGIGDRFERK